MTGKETAKLNVPTFDPICLTSFKWWKEMEKTTYVTVAARRIFQSRVQWGKIMSLFAKFTHSALYLIILINPTLIYLKMQWHVWNGRTKRHIIWYCVLQFCYPTGREVLRGCRWLVSYTKLSFNTFDHLSSVSHFDFKLSKSQETFQVSRWWTVWLLLRTWDLNNHILEFSKCVAPL